MTIEPITFVDRKSGDEAFVLVRVVGGVVGLVLSLKKSADIEVFMEAEDLDRVIGALQEGRSAIRGERSGIVAQGPRA